MTTIEDTLTDDEKDEFEQAARRSRRSKTKYGSLLEDSGKGKGGL